MRIFVPAMVIMGIGVQSTLLATCCGGTCSCKTVDKNKQAIKQAYGKVAQTNGSCSCVGGCCGGGADLAKYIGYTDEELKAVPEANLGLGCGNPVRLGAINEGDTVLDLGSGAGIDCLLAAKKVGPTGHVIGVDMTPAMLKKARANAKKYGFTNVEFRQGDIEQLPVASSSVNIVISNCVINLATDKMQVFREAHRVLKPCGKMYVSDVVLLGKLTKQQQEDKKLLCACVSGALLKDDYLNKLRSVGFEVTVVGQDDQIGKKWFNNTSLPIASLKFIATKSK